MCHYVKHNLLNKLIIIKEQFSYFIVWFSIFLGHLALNNLVCLLFFSFLSFFRSFFCLFLAVPRGMWDLSSLTRDRTHAPAVEARSPNYWTAREFRTPFLLL